MGFAARRPHSQYSSHRAIPMVSLALAANGVMPPRRPSGTRVEYTSQSCKCSHMPRVCCVYFLSQDSATASIFVLSVPPHPHVLHPRECHAVHLERLMSTFSPFHWSPNFIYAGPAVSRALPNPAVAASPRFLVTPNLTYHARLWLYAPAGFRHLVGLPFSGSEPIRRAALQMDAAWTSSL